MRFHLLFPAVCLAAVAITRTFGGPQPLHPNAVPVSPEITNAVVSKIGEGVFQIGQVRIDRTQRTVSLPAFVNMHEGTVEYALVHSSGKVHESIFKTDAQPYHINVALLLLGAKGGEVKTKTPEKKTSDVKGEPMDVFVAWTNSATQRITNIPLEQMVWDVETKSPAAAGPWIYNGSRIIEGTFLAQRDGSIISTIADPDALLNNPRTGRDNDDAWQVNTNNTPAVNTPVQITIQLRKQKQN